MAYEGSPVELHKPADLMEVITICGKVTSLSHLNWRDIVIVCFGNFRFH